MGRKKIIHQTEEGWITLKVEDYNAMSEEERKKWLGDKELRFKVTRHGVTVWRYDRKRQPTEKQIQHRIRFTKAAHQSRGEKGKEKSNGKLLPKTAVAVIKEFKKKEKS